MNRFTNIVTLCASLLLLAGCKTNPHNPYRVNKHPQPVTMFTQSRSIIRNQDNYLYCFLTDSNTIHITWTNTCTITNYVEQTTNLADWSGAVAYGPILNGQLDVPISDTNLFFRLRSSPCPGKLIWLRTSSIMAFGAQSLVKGVATDGTFGDIAAIAPIQGVINFGTTNIDGGNGSSCLLDYSSVGELQFAKPLSTGGIGATAVVANTVDQAGNIIVIGNFTGTNLDFGGGYLLTSHSDASGHDWGDIFLAKYSPEGNIIWAKGYGGTGFDAANGSCVAIDSSTNIVFAMMINGTVVFDGITNNGAYDDISLVKLTPAGVAIWAKLITGPDDERPLGIAVNNSNNIFLSGYFSPGATLCSGTITNLDPGTFIGKYSGTNGACYWNNTFRGTASGLAVAPGSGNVVLTGNMTQPVDFGHGNIGPGGVFLAAYNDAGSNVWAKCFNNSIDGYSSSDIGTAATVDSLGNIFFCGQLQHRASFNGAQAVDPPAFVASFTSAGVWRWSFNVIGSCHMRCITTDIFGHVNVGGDYSGTTDFKGITAYCPVGSVASFVAQYKK